MDREPSVDQDAALIAFIVFIFTLSLELFLFRELTFFNIIGSFAVFPVSFIIAKSILEKRPPIWEGLREWLKKPVAIKWLLLVLFISLLAICVINHYNQLEGIEGKLKCILPNGDIIIIDTQERKSAELGCIFPQVSNEVPFCGTETYATNGKTRSKFHNNTLDGRRYYTEITFQNFCNSTDCNSGWMVRPLRGYNASRFTHLSFWVRGAKGGEKFGVKIKDTRGTEVKVGVMEYTEGKKIRTHWQKVIIPLNHFLNVDMSTLSVISLYSDGKLSYKDSEIIYVTDFKLYG